MSGGGDRRRSQPRRLGRRLPRIACVRVPLFPLAARLRAEPELLEEGVVVTEGNGQAARVVAATRIVRRAGVRPGHTLTQARALLPGLIARGRDPECERSAQDALLDVADRFSPRVEDEGEGVVFLDTTGLERHYPGERPEHRLGQELMHALDRVGLPARIGIASSKLAARVAAKLPDSPKVIAPGEETAFLAPLPLHRLTPEAEVAATLERWGIETVGQMAELSHAEVASRLGEAGRRLHQAARGLDPRPLVARPPSPVFREGMTLEWPLTSLEPFLFIARTALERLCQRLETRGLGCRRLELSLHLEPDGFHDRSLDLPSPTREVKTLLTLIRLDLEAHPPGAPVTGFHLLAHPDAPKLAQLSLLGPAALSPDRLATTIARLFALLGPGRVGSPRTADGHRPERFRLVEYVPPPPPKIRPECVTGRGLLAVRVLRPALRIEVLTQGEATKKSDPARAAEVREGEVGANRGPRPIAIERLLHEGSEKLPKIAGRIRVASGPWELEERWWSQEPAEREYWDVEASDGGLYRIYRERRSGEWFADGIYD